MEELIVAAGAGLFGGFTRAAAHGEYVERPRYIEGKLFLGVIRFCWFGVIAAIIAWGGTAAADNIIGIIVLGLTSGFGSVWFFEKLKEREDAVEERSRMVDELAKDIKQYDDTEDNTA